MILLGPFGMRLLVVGANGLLGSNVVQTALDRGWDVTGTYHSTRPDFDVPLREFDLGEADSFDRLIDDHDPAVVVNCAAMTDVDRCESNPERAQALNADAPEKLARTCDNAGRRFVHVSTDYVFDGEATGPYHESDSTNPIQVYGQSKVAGEKSVTRTMPDALVPRLSFLWGIHRDSNQLEGFPAWALERLESGGDVPLFTDQRVTPTRAGQAARTILDLVDETATGIYHVACSSCVSPYEFGQLLVERLQNTSSSERPEDASDRLREGSMADVERAAPRPRRTCLSVEKVEAALRESQPTLATDLDSIPRLRRHI